MLAEINASNPLMKASAPPIVTEIPDVVQKENDPSVAQTQNLSSVASPKSSSPSAPVSSACPKPSVSSKDTVSDDKTSKETSKLKEIRVKVSTENEHGQTKNVDIKPVKEADEDGADSEGDREEACDNNSHDSDSESEEASAASKEETLTAAAAVGSLPRGVTAKSRADKVCVEIDADGVSRGGDSESAEDTGKVSTPSLARDSKDKVVEEKVEGAKVDTMPLAGTEKPSIEKDDTECSTMSTEKAISNAAPNDSKRKVDVNVKQVESPVDAEDSTEADESRATSAAGKEKLGGSDHTQSESQATVVDGEHSIASSKVSSPEEEISPKEGCAPSDATERLVTSPEEQIPVETAGDVLSGGNDVLAAEKATAVTSVDPVTIETSGQKTVETRESKVTPVSEAGSFLDTSATQSKRGETVNLQKFTIERDSENETLVVADEKSELADELPSSSQSKNVSDHALASNSEIDVTCERVTRASTRRSSEKRGGTRMSTRSDRRTQTKNAAANAKVTAKTVHSRALKGLQKDTTPVTESNAKSAPSSMAEQTLQTCAPKRKSDNDTSATKTSQEASTHASSKTTRTKRQQKGVVAVSKSTSKSTSAGKRSLRRSVRVSRLRESVSPKPARPQATPRSSKEDAPAVETPRADVAGEKFTSYTICRVLRVRILKFPQPLSCFDFACVVRLNY